MKIGQPPLCKNVISAPNRHYNRGPFFYVCALLYCVFKIHIFVKNQQKSNVHQYIGLFFPRLFQFSHNHQAKIRFFFQKANFFPQMGNFSHLLHFTLYRWLFGSTKTGHFGTFFNFFGLDSSTKIFSKITFNLVYRPLFPKK